MPRTPKQKKADEALTEAILDCWRAYYEQEEDEANEDVPAEALREGVPMEYLVIGTMHNVDSVGESYTRVFTLVRDGDASLHRLLGLTEFASTRFRGMV